MTTEKMVELLERHLLDYEREPIIAKLRAAEELAKTVDAYRLGSADAALIYTRCAEYRATGESK